MADRSTATPTRRSSTAGCSGSSTATRRPADYPYSQAAPRSATSTADSLTARHAQRRRRSTAGQVNYIRNSVKATVDAYDGTVTLYAWDDQDPMLKAWMQGVPGHGRSRCRRSPAT